MTERSGTATERTGPTMYDFERLSRQLEHGLGQLNTRVDWLDKDLRRTEQRVFEVMGRSSTGWSLYEGLWLLVPLALSLVAIIVALATGSADSN